MSIAEAKGHDQEFKMPIMCTENCFWDIRFMDTNLMKPRPKIELGKDLSVMKFIK